MPAKLGQYHVIAPVYLLSGGVGSIYPGPSSYSVGVTDEFRFADLLGRATAEKFGAAYLLDTQHNHMLTGWVLTSEGVVRGDATERYQHKGQNIYDPTGPSDVPVAETGSCDQCETVRASLPELDHDLVGLGHRYPKRSS